MASGECYICYDKTRYRSPCVCGHFVHSACLQKAIRKGFDKCGVCQGELYFFEWTPAYLRKIKPHPRAYNEEFFRTAFYLALLTYMTDNLLRAGVIWAGVCTGVYTMRWCHSKISS